MKANAFHPKKLIFYALGFKIRLNQFFTLYYLQPNADCQKLFHGNAGREHLSPPR